MHAATGKEQALGRAPELAALQDFLTGGAAAHALVLTGAPGIGKTTLWEAGVAARRERASGPARPAERRRGGAVVRGADRPLRRLGEAELAGLPAPQRRALEAALLPRRARASAAEPQAIALGLLNALRARPPTRPVLVAIDDVQWLDAPSADALAFAARRLATEPVGFLLARRPGRRPRSSGRSTRAALERLDVGPLDVDATGACCPSGSGSASRARCCSGSTRRRSATRCSRSRSGAR